MGARRYLEVSQLSEAFVAIIQSAEERLRVEMRLEVSSDIPALGKALAALVALKWLLACVSTLVCLED
jgi:hypothetical protein